MNPFDISKIIFENPSRWSELSNIDKNKNFFILNRMFSRNYPLQAQAFNNIKINTISVMNFWQTFLSKIYNKTPHWMFIKGIKKTNEIKDKKYDVSKESILNYAKLHDIDMKTIYDTLQFYPQEMQKEIKQFEKTIK